jgi:hypothetical protein
MTNISKKLKNKHLIMNADIYYRKFVELQKRRKEGGKEIRGQEGRRKGREGWRKEGGEKKDF